MWIVIAGYAKALHTVLEANGGAQTCTLEPGSPQFQMELRKQLYATSFTGVTGQVAVSQCSTANHEDPNLVSGSEELCGDRTGMLVQIQGYGLYGEVPEWKSIGIVNVELLSLDLDGEFIFLGNTSVVPVDFVPSEVCQPGYWQNSLKECIPCSMGTYSDTNAQLMCNQCPLGIL